MPLSITSSVPLAHLNQNLGKGKERHLRISKRHFLGRRKGYTEYRQVQWKSAGGTMVKEAKFGLDLI